MTVFLLAGNYGEFKSYMNEKGLTRGVFYVSGMERLKGRNIGARDKIVMIGTFYQRKDASALLAEIECCKNRS